MTASALTLATEALTHVAAPASSPAAVAPDPPAAAAPTVGALTGAELVAWATARTGAGPVPDTVDALAAVLIPLELAVAVRTRGAVLVGARIAGISLGDGRAIAPTSDGAAYAIVSAAVGWQTAGKVPGVTYLGGV
jgi:hypothetical protein